MENFKKLLRLAKNLELKYIIAQKISAQPGDIEMALKAAGVWNLSNEVAPLLNAAKVSDTDSVEIIINVKPGPNVSFTALINPSNPKVSQTLSLLLLKNFSKKMTDALRAANLDVTDVLTVKWLTF